VGIVLGHMARRQLQQSGEQGAGLATAGIWIGYVVTALELVGLLVWFALLAFGVYNGVTST
jgi:hypothetical protein